MSLPVPRRRLRLPWFLNPFPLTRSVTKPCRRRRARPKFDRLESRRFLTGGPPASGGPWEQVLDETWDGLDAGVWTNALFWGGDNKTYAATFLPQNVTAGHGILSIAEHNTPTTANDGSVQPLSLGAVSESGGLQGRTAPGFAFKYGYVSAGEMRARRGDLVEPVHAAREPSGRL